MGKLPAICQSPVLHLTSKTETVVCPSNIIRDFQRDKVRYLGCIDCQIVNLLSVVGSVKKKKSIWHKESDSSCSTSRGKEYHLIPQPLYPSPNMHILLFFILVQSAHFMLFAILLIYLQTD